MKVKTELAFLKDAISIIYVDEIMWSFQVMYEESKSGKIMQ